MMRLLVVAFALFGLVPLAQSGKKGAIHGTRYKVIIL